MFRKYYFLIVIVGSVNSSVSVRKNAENETTVALGSLLSYALQSRQFPGYDAHLEQNVIPEQYYHQYQSSFPPTNYPIYPYAPPFPYENIPFETHLTDFPKPHFPRPIYSDDVNDQPPTAWEHTKQSIMDVLYSISTNDDLQCVPKILCEVTSGAIVGRQSGTNLPVNIDMESLVGFLSSFNGIQESPLLYFGKAAILGYTSKNKPRTCDRAYPECPRDPNKLVQYLNNHNGGFFRYFNGIHPPQMQFQNHFPHYQQQIFEPIYDSVHSQSYAPYYQGQNYQDYTPVYQRQKALAEKRIQNKPTSYIPVNSIEDQRGIYFPSEDSGGFRTQKELTFPPSKDHFNLVRTRNPLKFPEDNYEDYPDQPFRKPKELPYDISFYHTNDLDLQKPLPNHKATQMIFPDRTGTGELRLDLQEVNDGSSVAFEDDDVRVKLKGFRNEYNIRDNANIDVHFFDNRRGGKASSFFPSR